MAALFRTSTPTNTTPPATSLRVQTSVEGKCRALLYGMTRIPPNLIWYGDFYSETQPGSGGGKGGLFRSPGGGGGSTTYFASVEMALAEGPVAAIGPRVWNSKAVTTVAEAGFGTFLGAVDQSPWSYLVSAHPDQALAYRRTALAVGNLALGQSAELANFTFEVTAIIAYKIPGVPDADPMDVLADFLSNALSGVAGWDSSYNGNWGVASGYCLAAGLLVSVALTDQVSANQWVADVIDSLNCLCTFSEGVLKIVPLGDRAITAGAQSLQSFAIAVPNTPNDAVPYSIQAGTAATFVSDQGVKYTSSGNLLTRVDGTPSVGQYTVTLSGLYGFAAADVGTSVTISYILAAVGNFNPPVAPIYEWTSDDFLPNQGSVGSGSGIDPVACQRTAPRQINNVVKVEYLDRSGDYNPASIKASDDSLVRLYGERSSKGTRTWHWFQYASAAQMAASLALGRERIANTYTVTVPPRYILLDPGDLVSITDADAGLNKQWCRVRRIQENQDRSLTFTLTEYLEGTGAAPLYGEQALGGSRPNYNADPGPLNTPLIFEPTDELAGGLEVWVAASGSSALFGGYDAYVSYDATNYQFVSRQVGNARMGLLTAPLPTVSASPTGPTIDTVNTLSVNLSESLGVLGSGSQQDALALNTACWIDGEVVSYQDATLTSAYHYDLTYLVRGGYGTESKIATHNTGTAFARLDPNILRIPFDPTRVGATIYIKLVPLNLWMGGPATVADVGAVPYTITGAALSSPLPIVTGLHSNFTDGFEEIYWTEITDFRSGIRYKIYLGDAFVGSLQVGDVAHPPFKARGNGTFWVVAYCQPAPSLLVYSESPASISISGNMLVANLVYQSDQKAAGWPGDMSSGVGINNGNLILGGAGDILSVTDILALPDVIDYGGVVASGTYSLRPQDRINVGYLANCYVTASWLAVGVPADQNILTMDDILAQPDILGSASTQFISAKIQIRTATSPDPGDLYGLGDLYSEGDLYSAGIAWTDWKDFVPGVYRAWLIDFRMGMETVDPNTTPTVLAFSYSASVQPRIDHYPNMIVLSTGTTITYEPDDASAPSPFNGGPPVGGVANQPLPFLNFSVVGQAGLKAIIDSQDLAHVTFHFEDSGGTPTTVEDCSVTAEGF